MRILIWNVNGLIPTVPNFVLTHGTFAGFFEHHKADLICFQETKLPSFDKLTKDIACPPDFESFWAISREKKGYSGTATFVHKTWSPIQAQVDCLGSGQDDIDREGRVVLTDHEDFVLINVYAPNAGASPERPRAAYKYRFLEALQAKVASLISQGREVLVVGDLNIAASQADVHDKLDREQMYSQDEKALFASLLDELTDIWRKLHPNTSKAYTVWDEKTSARAFNEGVRIDYALCSPGLVDKVVSCEIEATPPKWSDHAGLILELKDVTPPPAHPPCALSSAKMKQFNDRSQRSIASMFAPKKTKATAEPANGASKRLKAGTNHQAGRS